MNERYLCLIRFHGFIQSDVHPLFDRRGSKSSIARPYSANNEASVKELGDETLRKIAHELTENLRKNVSIDWSVRESVRAKLRLMVKRILRKYKYPPDKQEEAIELVMQQAEILSAEWS